MQDGRVYIELINGPFLFRKNGMPDEYKAGLDLAFERGWLVDRSGTFVRFTQTGADLVSYTRLFDAVACLSRMPNSAFLPCIPTNAAKVPNRPEWIHEIKHDGYRLIVPREGERVRLFTRTARLERAIPAVIEAALRIRNTSFVIDGEAALLGVDGRSDFNGLHSRKHNQEVEFHAFDMLVSDGDDIRKLPLSVRKTADKTTEEGLLPPLRQNIRGSDSLKFLSAFIRDNHAVQWQPCFVLDLFSHEFPHRLHCRRLSRFQVGQILALNISGNLAAASCMNEKFRHLSALLWRRQRAP